MIKNIMKINNKILNIVILLLIFFSIILGVVSYNKNNTYKYTASIQIKDGHNIKEIEQIIEEHNKEKEIEEIPYEEPVEYYPIETIEESQYIEEEIIMQSNEYNYQVLYLINDIRKSYGLNELIMDNTLINIATIRAQEASINWSHTRPDGTKWYTLFQEYGIYGTLGENLAYGQESPQEVVEAWMNSEGHKANILHSDFNRIGIAVYNDDGILYWAQSFAD